CFFFSSRRRHTISNRDWSSDVCSSDLCTWPAPSVVGPSGLWSGLVLSLKPDHSPLGPTTDGAGQVQRGRLRDAPGQDELLQRGDLCLVAIDRVLERVDLLNTDRRPSQRLRELRRVWSGELGSNPWQVSLDRLQQLAAEGPGVERHGKADRGVELVHLSVGIHPEVRSEEHTSELQSRFELV